MAYKAQFGPNETLLEGRWVATDAGAAAAAAESTQHDRRSKR